MTTAAQRAPTSAVRTLGVIPLVVAFAALAVPTTFTLMKQQWSQDAGAHGPIILAAGGWLLWRQRPEFAKQAVPGRPALSFAVLILSLLLYVFGRAYDFLTLEAAGLYGIGLAMLHTRLGVRAMLKAWFPFVFLSFAIPPPHWIIDGLTAPLKEFVSFVSAGGLAAVGLPVARQGVTIFVAQYQLLVEDACSGMNSLIGLTAISLLYIYLTRGSSLVYSLVLTAFVIPIAVAANIVRIVILILLTYYGGDAVAQGFLHFTAGIVLFATALMLVFALDRGLALAWPAVSRAR